VVCDRLCTGGLVGTALLGRRSIRLDRIALTIPRGFRTIELSLAVVAGIGLVFEHTVPLRTARGTGESLATTSNTRSHDAMIAAVALANDPPLFTCNPDDFEHGDGLDLRSVPHPDQTPGT
jgi:hypothetical protein